MLLHPLENKGQFTTDWIQTRPYVTQVFGARPDYYSKYKMRGHNGKDYRAAVGTPVFAPHDGYVYVKGSADSTTGYGLHVRIRSPFGARESTLAHLSDVVVINDEMVFAGELIGFTGNSGDSSAPHLHWTFRRLIESKKNIWSWEVENFDNGYNGAVDVSDFTITFKGTESNPSIYNPI